MGREMVIYHGSRPFWRRLRQLLLMLFWLGWCSVLGAVVYLTVTHPKCAVIPYRDWWQTASVYQIYPRSFKDSNGDGVGDLRGILTKLDYLKEIGTDAVWISPFYKSPMKDFGYDVSDYIDIDEMFGSLADFDELIKEMHKKGIKLIMDFIPNHTSDQHAWFEMSVKREPGYENFYIWRDCGTNGTQPPNNWISVATLQSAWTYHPVRGQCYFHQYQESMPDLNIRNNAVRDELDKVLRFWLDRGVDGIRVDAIIRLYEDYDLRNETVVNGNLGDYRRLHHNMTNNHPDIMNALNRWRALLDSYPGSTRVMITEAYASPNDLIMYYGRTPNGGAHFPFNFQLTSVNSTTDGYSLAKSVSDWMASIPGEGTANWVLGNHDVPRIGSRVGRENIDAMSLLLMTLPGVATTYYGDEIGMMDIDISDRESLDPIGKQDKSRSRDPERSPMQWTPESSSCHGFTTNCSMAWLPLHPNSTVFNVQDEKADSKSHLSVYKQLMELRTNLTFIYGRWREHVVTENIYSFIRYYDDLPMYLICVNIGDVEANVDLSVSEAHADDPTIAFVTGNSERQVKESEAIAEVKLTPGEGVVYTWPRLPKQ